MNEGILPRPAATVLPLRDVDNGIEVLLLQRNPEAKFMGGAFVFPGGRIDSADHEIVRRCLAFGMTDEAASWNLGIEEGGLAYYVAGLRELFEEANILIACDERGHTLLLRDENLRLRLLEYRTAINNGEIDFVEMLGAEGLFCDLRNMSHLAHWVTPVGPPRRFDTRFFVAIAPGNQVAICDGAETIDEMWIAPADALAARARGDLDLRLPTARNLEAISQFKSSLDVLAFVRSLSSVPRIEMNPHLGENDDQNNL
jgi:8-oxo-dGTP pyrophosphatase MutT (NUDIX family)